MAVPAGGTHGVSKVRVESSLWCSSAEQFCGYHHVVTVIEGGDCR